MALRQEPEFLEMTDVLCTVSMNCFLLKSMVYCDKFASFLICLMPYAWQLNFTYAEK